MFKNFAQFTNYQKTLLKNMFIFIYLRPNTMNYIREVNPNANIFFILERSYKIIYIFFLADLQAYPAIISNLLAKQIKLINH